MNRNAAKAIDWTQDDLWNYFGLGRNGVSGFIRHWDFAPGSGTLAMSAPRQLHATSLHADGHYVHVEGGTPKMRADVVAMLDGIPWKVMNAAHQYLREVDLEAWIALEKTTHRLRHETIEYLASKMDGVTRQTVYNRLHRALGIISSYLDRELDQAVGA